MDVKAALMALFLGANVLPAQGATFDFIVEGGGVQQVYRLDNGNFLGLWGFDTRNALTTGGAFTTADITGFFTRGSSTIVGYYYGGNTAFNGAAAEFDAIVGPLSLPNGQRFFDSVWVEWTSGSLIFNSIGLSRSMNPSNVSLPGEPFAAAAVPLPGGWWMMLAGLAGLVGVRRFKAASQRGGSAAK